MILKEQNNQKKTLPDGMLDMNHEHENTPTTNGKVQIFTSFFYLMSDFQSLTLMMNHSFESIIKDF